MAGSKTISNPWIIRDALEKHVQADSALFAEKENSR
jgi:hypothetical protein